MSADVVARLIDLVNGWIAVDVIYAQSQPTLSKHFDKIPKELVDLAEEADESEDDTFTDRLWELLPRLGMIVAQAPLAAVSISAMAHKGRIPELYPFEGNCQALSAIVRKEGLLALWMGALPWVLRDEADSLIESALPRRFSTGFLRILRVLMTTGLFYPLSVVAARQITIGGKAYSDVVTGTKTVLDKEGAAGLFRGIDGAALSALAFIVFPSWGRNLPLSGVPTLRARLPDSTGTAAAEVSNVYHTDGVWGFFAGTRALLWGLFPSMVLSFTGYCSVRLLMGRSPRQQRRYQRGKARLQVWQEVTSIVARESSERQTSQ